MTAPSTLAEAVDERLAAGGAERRGEVAFLPVATLDSGARVALGAGAAFLLVPEEGDVRPAGPAQPLALLEVLESPREAFEDLLASGARAAGLPPDDVSLAFPALPLVQAALATRSGYVVRLALRFLRTTELRPLRAEIAAVAVAKELPVPVRELASRLVVPE